MTLTIPTLPLPAYGAIFGATILIMATLPKVMKFIKNTINGIGIGIKKKTGTFLALAGVGIMQSSLFAWAVIALYEIQIVQHGDSSAWMLIFMTIMFWAAISFLIIGAFASLGGKKPNWM